MIDAHQQLQEFATQDRQDLVPQFAAMKEGIDRRAAEYRRRLVEVEPLQLEALRPIVAKAFRRPITDTQWKSLVDGYQKLRSDDLSHEEAIRLSMARILVSPAFLYRAEHPQGQQPVGPLDDWQLASRGALASGWGGEAATAGRTGFAGPPHAEGSQGAQAGDRVRVPVAACAWLRSTG
jgi:hypothetical protein